MKSGVKLNLFLVAAIAACIFQIRTGGRDLSQPNVVYMPDMAYSKAAESFSRNPVFRSGITLQVPPEGTIARGSLFPPGPGSDSTGIDSTGIDSTGVDSTGIDSTGIALLVDAEAALRGATGFRRYCQPCHGASAKGDGPVATRGYPPPPTLLRPESRALPDEELFRIITSGKGNMPGHGKMIAVEDRWSIIRHVRTLQEAASAREPAPADSSASSGGGS